jgi:hypothetical protein
MEISIIENLKIETNESKNDMGLHTLFKMKSFNHKKSEHILKF